MEYSLSEEELNSFKENGFLGPFKVYEREEAIELGEQICKKSIDKTFACWGEDNHMNYDRHLDIDELTHHIYRPQIVQRLNSIMGQDLLCWRGEFFMKYPGGNGTEWHQVESYKYSTGEAHIVPTNHESNLPFQLTVWTAFTDTDRTTACMKFMPGSHKHWYFDESKHVEGRDDLYTPDIFSKDTSFYGYDYAKFKVDEEWEPNEKQARALEMKAGEAVIFTAKCMHASYPNTSKSKLRLAYAARYVPTHVRVYPDINEFIEHGSKFNVEKFGSVLVSGTDEYKHNPIKNTNNYGIKIPIEVE